MIRQTGSIRATNNQGVHRIRNNIATPIWYRTAYRGNISIRSHSVLQAAVLVVVVAVAAAVVVAVFYQSSKARSHIHVMLLRGIVPASSACCKNNAARGGTTKQSITADNLLPPGSTRYASVYTSFQGQDMARYVAENA